MKIRFAYALLFAILSFFLWSFRSIMFEKTDLAYLKRYYEASQWVVPLSPRTMGDAQLYQFVGVQLVHGEDPFLINSEVPPLGKYLYGLSIVLFQNPYIITVGFLLVSSVFFYVLIRHVFHDEIDRWFALALFLLNPLTLLQLSQTLMDLPQMTFLLGHIVCLLQLSKRKGWSAILIAILSGIFLGWFAGVKVGLMVVLVVSASGYYLWKEKRLRFLFPVFIGAAVAYIAVYTQYFVHGHSLLDFLRAQKWMFMLYASSKVHPIVGMELITLMTGLFKGWWNGARLEYQYEWSILLPIGVVLFTVCISKMAVLKERVEPVWMYIYLLCAALIGINLMLPFWPRYMVLYLPFLILVVVRNFPRLQLLRFGVVGIVCVQSLFGVVHWSLFPITTIANLWNDGWYGELYQELSPHSRVVIEPQKFEQIMYHLDHSLKLSDKKIEITWPRLMPWQAQAIGEAKISYITPLGLLEHTAPITFIQEHGRWNAEWNWDAVLPHFTPDAIVSLHLDSPQDGVLKSSDGIVLSETKMQPFLFAVPQKLSDGEQFVSEASQLTGKDKIDVRITMRVRYLADEEVPLGFIESPYYENQLTEIQQWKGVMVRWQSRRIRITEHANIPIHHEVIAHYEETSPNLFATVGGNLSLVLKDGRTIEEQNTPSRDGVNISLPKTFQQLVVE